MTEAELLTYLKVHYPKENEACEWKSFANLRHNVSAHKGEDIISYVSAIANMSGGHLVIGVEDKTLAIIGIQNPHDYTPENLPARLLGNCTNLSSEGLQVEPFITSDTAKTIWVIHIPRHIARKPVYAHKTAWQRKGDNLIALTQEREAAILNEPIHRVDDWSCIICEEATLNDLDPAAVLSARANFKIKNPRIAHEVDGWDEVTFLNKAKVTINGKITRTAIILLGKPESEHFISPAVASITWVLRDKDKVEKDYAHFSCPFILAVDAVFAKIRNLKYRYMKDGTLFPDEVDQYDPFTLKEALSNCIAHQDYSLGGRITVAEREDGYLTFTNLGEFLPGSIENVIQSDSPPQYYRNQFLSQAMVNLNMIDTIGSGIKRMFRLQSQRFFPMPDYDISKGKVSATLTGKVLDIEYARMLAQNPNLTLEEIIMLDKTQKKKPLTTDEIKHLREKGLVEGRKNMLHISASLAAATGQTVDYMRTKGVDEEFIRKTIKDYLERFGEAKRDVFDSILLSKLSDGMTKAQKQNKIKNAVQAMKREGIIEINGKRWKLAPPKD